MVERRGRRKVEVQPEPRIRRSSAGEVREGGLEEGEVVMEMEDNRVVMDDKQDCIELVLVDIETW